MLLNLFVALAPFLISTRITGTKIAAFVVLVIIVGGAFLYYRSRARAA